MGRFAIVLGCLLVSVAVYSRPFSIIVPKQPRVTAVVDEVGGVLFGSKPASVQVTNPTPSATVFTVYGSTTCPGSSVQLYSGSILAVVPIGAGSDHNASISNQCFQAIPPTAAYTDTEPPSMGGGSLQSTFFFHAVADCAVCRL